MQTSVFVFVFSWEAWLQENNWYYAGLSVACSTMLLACQAICARFCMTSSKRCSSVSRRDILDCSRTQYTTYAEFFTEVTGDEKGFATVCWHAVRVPGPLPSSRKPGASTWNFFGEFILRMCDWKGSCWQGRQMFGKDGVLIITPLVKQLRIFVRQHAGQEIPTHSSVSAQLWIIMHKLRRAHHQIYPCHLR